MQATKRHFFVVPENPCELGVSCGEGSVIRRLASSKMDLGRAQAIILVQHAAAGHLDISQGRDQTDNIPEYHWHNTGASKPHSHHFRFPAQCAFSGNGGRRGFISIQSIC